jgi:tetratricopeptide (TPR) repeat protein
MNLKPLFAALAAISLLAYAADTPDSNPSVRAPSVNDRLAAARNAINAKDWTRAMSELNVAVREDPRNADVHNLLGYSYRKRAAPDITKAFEHYSTALRLDRGTRARTSTSARPTSSRSAPPRPKSTWPNWKRSAVARPVRNTRTWPRRSRNSRPRTRGHVIPGLSRDPCRAGLYLGHRGWIADQVRNDSKEPALPGLPLACCPYFISGCPWPGFCSIYPLPSSTPFFPAISHAVRWLTSLARFSISSSV